MHDKLTVATVLKPQGIRGEVKVKALTDSAEDLKGLKKLFIDGVEYPVLSVRAQGDFAYMGLKGVADRNAAELLRGKDMLAERSEMPELPDGRYYIVDLIGCEVVTERGDFIGEVTEVTPAKTDIYTLDAGGKSITFVAADGVITEVDVAARKITVNEKRFREVSL
ncbi:MAG TPA: 16S rRNA processing protein RimM [Clostridiales bacterium]|nr:16S rRNA processing protein RimM [Clostridiales bacterium]